MDDDNRPTQPDLAGPARDAEGHPPGRHGRGSRGSWSLLPDARILTDQGFTPVGRLVERASGGARAPTRAVMTHLGREQPVTRAFRQPFEGQIVQVRPRALPPFDCTFDHPLLARREPRPGEEARAADFIPARQLTASHLLAVPKAFAFGEVAPLDAAGFLRFVLARRAGAAGPTPPPRGRYDQGEPGREQPSTRGSRLRGPAAGRSRVLGAAAWPGPGSSAIVEGGRVRLSSERGPGIPALLPVDPALGRLLGLFVASGTIRGGTIGLATTGADAEPALETHRLFATILGGQADVTVHPERAEFSIVAPAAALLLEALCGRRPTARRVPAPLFSAGREVADAFVGGFVRLGGYRHADGTITASMPSEELAWGIFGLLLKLGRMPAFHRYASRAGARAAQPTGDRFVLRWHEPGRRPAGWLEDDQYIYLPLREVNQRPYQGPVYHLTVAEDHTYLVNGAVSHD